MKYIAKKDTWFDEGTEATLLTRDTCLNANCCALFKGIRNGRADEEICSYDEFEVEEI